MKRIGVGLEREASFCSYDGFGRAVPQELFYQNLLEAEGTTLIAEDSQVLASNLFDAAKAIVAQEKRMQAAARQYDLALAPASPFDAHGPIEWTQTKRYRTRTYGSAFGEEVGKLILSHAGLHFHGDHDPRRPAESYNAMLALTPALIALCAATPMDLTGKTQGHASHRYHDVLSAEGYFSNLPAINGYVEDIEELDRRARTMHSQWRDAVIQAEGDVEEFDNYFQPDNTGWPHQRHRPPFGEHGTNENRVADSTSADFYLTAFALVLGYLRRIHDLPIERGMNGSYEFGSKKVIIPSQYRLNELTKQAAHGALEDPQALKYTHDIWKFATGGLEPTERQLMHRAFPPIWRGDTLSSLMRRKIGEPAQVSQYSPEQARMAKKFAFERQRAVISGLEDYLREKPSAVSTRLVA